MIKILVYDDNDERRESLVALFRLQQNLFCLGSFSDCSKIKEQVATLLPDLILMDIRMPGMSGIEATRLVKQHHPAIKIIMQTVYEDDENIFNSLKAGAEGYLLKSTSAEKILQSISEVHLGGAVITPSIALRITRFFTEELKVPHPDHGLTPRELEILHLLADGLSYKMIAGKLSISYNTVNAHIRRIYQKLEVNSSGEAISVALRKRFV